MSTFTLKHSPDMRTTWFAMGDGVSVAELTAWARPLTASELASLAASPPTFKAPHTRPHRRTRSARARRRVMSWARRPWWTRCFVDCWPIS